MKITVVGCGKIGKTILASLTKEQHEVLAIDRNPDVIKEIANRFDVMCTCGNGTEYELLKEAGTENTDLFIAVTNSDEFNMLSCFAAKRMGAKYTVARIRNAENNTLNSLEFMKQQLDLSLSINPELLTASAICDILKLPSATNVESFSSRGLKLIELPLKTGGALDGMTISELKMQTKLKFLVGTVSREEQVFIPNGSFALHGGDKVGLIVPEGEIEKILKLFNVEHKQVKDVIIIGGGTTSEYLAELLMKNRINVKIVERDEKRCEEMCEKLGSGVTVIHGDGMSQDLLAEEGINSADSIVALTGFDEQNILISFYAISQNVRKVLAKVNSDDLSAISRKLGLDCMISPKNIAADIIVSYARAIQNSIGSKTETLYSILNGQAEALEFKVMPDFSHANIPLKELKFKPDVLIAGIKRGRQAIIPSGDDVITPGDNVIVISKSQAVLDLSDAFQVK